ncbi:hypothetical protein AX16_006320 [Volvariella volvacea WC 439]|nr:hypothetical protein AX16_006320 [Volvariella volvacea WC 439]
MPSSSLKAQIAEIDSEIHLLAVKMAELRRRRNALMPFSTLPREIISKVLHHAVENAVVAVERQADNEGNYEVITGSIYDWTSITQFCMEWRLVALGQSTLWTQIRTTNSGWAKAFFQRSKDQLVCVDTSRGRTTDAEYDEVLRLVVSNMHRIRSLRLDANSVEERILWLRNISAPQLEVLKYSGEFVANFYFGFRLTLSSDLVATGRYSLLIGKDQVGTLGFGYDLSNWLQP